MVAYKPIPELYARMPELLLAATLSWKFRVLFMYRSHEWRCIEDVSESSTRTVMWQHIIYPTLHLAAQESPSIVVWQFDTDSLDEIVQCLEVAHVLHISLEGKGDPGVVSEQ